MTLVLSVVSIYLLLNMVGCVYHLYCWDKKSGPYSGNTRSMMSPYECGFCSRASSESTFSHSYLLLLVFFVLFDLEMTLLLKLPFQGDLFFSYVSYMVFILFVCLGYTVEVVKGYVSWSR